MAELAGWAAATRRQLAEDLATMSPLDPPRRAVDPEDAAAPLGRTQGGVAVHVYEELAQHYGQMQLTRDVLRAASGGGASHQRSIDVNRLA